MQLLIYLREYKLQVGLHIAWNPNSIHCFWFSDVWKYMTYKILFW